MPDDFAGKSLSLVIQLYDKKVIKVGYEENMFVLLIQNTTIKQEANYTYVYDKMEEKDENYICLESECKYVCVVRDYYKEWYYRSGCYMKVSDFKTLFNNVYNEAYDGAKNYNGIKNEKRIKDERKSGTNKEIKVTKGYYYEDVKENNENGYDYKGYFLIDNILTIIKQGGEGEYVSQSGMQQLKLVLTLDSQSSIFNIL